MCYQFIFCLLWIFANLIGEKLYLSILLIWTYFYFQGFWLRCNRCSVLLESEDLPGPSCGGRAHTPDFLCHTDLFLPVHGWVGLWCYPFRALSQDPAWDMRGPWDLTSVGKLPWGVLSSTKDHAVLPGWSSVDRRITRWEAPMNGQVISPFWSHWDHSIQCPSGPETL